MSTAAVFLIVAALAASIGSVGLYLGHRVRRSSPPDFSEQLRAIAPRDTKRPPTQPSGIVPIDPATDEER